MARKIIPLRPQKQVDQAIKNFILDKSHARKNQVNICLGGGTSIHLMISSNGVRAYRMYKSKYVFLGYYFSEELVTDPELIDYEMPPDPYFTYDEILQRGEEVKRYGRVISDDPIGEINVKDSKCENGKLVPNIYTKDYPIQPPSISLDNPFGYKLLSDSVNETLSERPATQKKVDAAKLEEEVKVDDEKKEKETLKESLKRRLRLLDLKIEREEILNQLAAL